MQGAFRLEPATPLPVDQRQALLDNPGFGRVFTDHMVTIPFQGESGWGQGIVSPYRSLSLDPAAAGLHYGQAIFEGFKAYRQLGGGIKSFRPRANAERFQASARRLAMPELPVDTFVEAADILVRQDRGWVPDGEGMSLYLRPMMIASERSLLVRPSQEYLFVLIASPSGPYFSGGVRPVSVWLCEQYVRASKGGTGEAKCAGNYGASLPAQALAEQAGCDQVVWLDPIERRWVEEMGGMNVFFVFERGGKPLLVTPRLTGTLLPGITRRSLLELCPTLGYEVEERDVSAEEWSRAVADGTMTEAFACGTAAVITPIGEVKGRSGGFVINGKAPGPIALQLRQHLLDVQYGRQPDSFDWMHAIV